MIARGFNRVWPGAPGPAVPEALGPARRGWSNDRSIAPQDRSDWIERGLVTLRGVYSADMIERYNRCVAAVRETVPDGKDAHGLGDRIGQLHQKHPELLELAGAPRVLGFLRWAFGGEAMVFGSLNFERGTQQFPHVDALFFCTEPVYAMAGVWVALEDIHPDSGPLFYLPGSHRWPFAYGDDLVARRPALAAARERVRRGEAPPEELEQTRKDLASAWIDTFTEDYNARNPEPVTLPLQRGDVVIWHALLAHGGSAQVNPALSRRSVVFHYVGRAAKLFDMHQFMQLDRAELRTNPGRADQVLMRGRLPYKHFPYFTTYQDGQEVIHTLP